MTPPNSKHNETSLARLTKHTLVRDHTGPKEHVNEVCACGLHAHTCTVSKGKLSALAGLAARVVLLARTPHPALARHSQSHLCHTCGCASPFRACTFKRLMAYPRGWHVCECGRACHDASVLASHTKAQCPSRTCFNAVASAEMVWLCGPP